MRSVGSVGLNTVLGLARGLGAGALGTAIAIALLGSSVPGDAYAQYRSSSQVQSTQTQRYVSSTTRRVAVPVRNQRVYSPPRGARLLTSRYWDPRTRWNVDSRTRSTYAVLRNGEVWFLEPTSGWAYTVDRYGRVYGADPRRNSIYAFSSLHSWRGDLFYFFDFFSPYDGYYTVRDYDWFYSSYYGRRAPLYDYGYAYRTMWNDFDDYWFSNRFYRTISFRYYQPQYIRYGYGWNSRYYHRSLPSVYIAPCYSYTVVNNTVVVNNNYYTVNNITNNNGGRGLPTAEQAAVQLSQQVKVPTMGTSNQISEQQLSVAGIQAPPEPVREISIQAAAPIIAAEPAIEVPGMVVSEPLPAVDPALTAKEPAFETPQQPAVEPTYSETQKEPGLQSTPQEPVQEPTVEPSYSGTEKEPVYETTPQEPVVEPTYQQPAVEPAYSGAEKEPEYQEPTYQEPVVEPSYSETQKEPAYEEPAYQEPVQEPTYQEPAYEQPSYQETQKEPAYEEPAYQEPAYQEPVTQEPAYQEPAYQEPVNQEPAYQEPAYEQPTYQETQKEPAYEEPAYQEPAYQEPAYQEPAYEAPQERYEAPQESYQAPEPSYEAPQERYEAPEPSYEAPQERYEAPQQEAPQQEAPREAARDSEQPQ